MTTVPAAAALIFGSQTVNILQFSLGRQIEAWYRIFSIFGCSGGSKER
jgi:hypothetical protein